jgi:hypothetical protein
MEVV